MCRNIQPLFNYDPPSTEEQIRDSALQFVRKVSGFRKPSAANEAAFELAVEEISIATKKLIDTLVTNAPPRDRAKEIERARARAKARFASNASG